ncbi:MAG: enoyl-CoA hydratase/isomerase family protein [Deltaproteobacteria bacterium]|nr:enoyl-CoA hydratase/isomerase family protein [Deltaproteobacteria bacterium]
MKTFTTRYEGDLAVVSFDQGGMNTLSRAAIEELDGVEAAIRVHHAAAPLAAVVLTGNRYGLGAGANIGELMQGSPADLATLIDRGDAVLCRIEEGPVPWVAVVDGVALGGIYELALACRAIVATKRSSVGLPEMGLNIFPGLGGTQRLPRRAGLVNAADPVAGDAALSVILQGKSLRAEQALAIHMIDAVVPEGEDPQAFAARFARERLGSLVRPAVDLSNAAQIAPMVLPTILKATQGRQHPRAPFVALEVVTQGVPKPLREGIKLERDRFLEVATSAEGKAGMRFFFTQQRVTKLPAELAKVAARPIRRVGIDGFDGYMGNAIAFLARRAGFEVVGHVPVPELAANAPRRMRQKYEPLLKRGRIDAAAADAEVASVTVATDLSALADCDLVIEARKEDPEAKAAFYRALAKVVRPDTIVSSNSSSMGPGFLAEFFQAGGGNPVSFVNLHFFSPAEHPQRALVEVVRTPSTSPDVLAALHGFVRKIGKVPVMLQDGSPGFLVNAALAEYFREAETLFREGTPIERIDEVMRERVFPLGPFEVADQAGVDVAAGMFDVIARTAPPPMPPLVTELRDRGRFGVKSGGGFYDYGGGKKGAPWSELPALVAPRGTRVAEADEIVDRCVRSMYQKSRELLGRGIVASREESDLAFVYALGFAMYLGGPFFYAEQRGWS